jgi:hypothetical protein
MLMASCELKNKLEQLKKEERVLLGQAKNEVVLTEIICNKEILTDAENALLDTFLGSKIKFLAIGINMKYRKVSQAEATKSLSHLEIMEQLQDDIAKMKLAIDADPVMNMKMRVVSISKPDAKYNTIDFTLNKARQDETAAKKALADAIAAGEEIDQSEPAGVGRYFKRVMASIVGEEKTNRRYADAQATRAAYVAELEEATVGSKEHDRLIDRIQRIDNKLSGKGIVDAIIAIGDLGSNEASKFPQIFATTASYESKKGKLKSIDVIKDEVKAGYTSAEISRLFIGENNTIDSEHEKGQLSSANNDEVSTFATLFGISGKTITIPEYVKNAIKINGIEHMEGIYKVLGYEPGSKEFNDAWAVDETTITEDELATITEAHLSGKIPQSVILTSLGKAVYRSLPIKFSKELDMELEQKAVAQLGLYALRYMHSMYMIRIDDKSTTYNGGSKDQILIQANMSNEENENGVIPSEKIMSLVAELQHIGASEDRSSPRDVNDQYEVSQTIRNSFIETSENVRESLKAYEATKFRFNDHMLVLYDMYMNPNGGKEAAYAMAGVLSVDSTKSIPDQMKELAKINYAKMQIDSMMKVYEDFGIDGKEFTLPYDYTVSGRYMINSIFNPQESKISRFLVTTKDIDSVIGLSSDGKTLSADDMNLFKVGLAQSFDLDPDKTTDLNAIEGLGQIVTISNTGAVAFTDMYKDKGNPFKVVYDALNKGELAGVISPALKDAMMLVNRKGSGFHAMQAIMALKQLNDASKLGEAKPVRLSFSLESDAITSGMILTLMQIGSKEALELASKGGVYTDEVIAHWKSMHDLYKGAGGKIDALTQSDNNTFKITHGWLRAFSKDFKARISNENDTVFKDNIINSELMKADLDNALEIGIEKYISDKVEFNDFYETVAKSANDEMKAIRVNVIDNVKDILAEIVDGKVKGDVLKELNKKLIEMNENQILIDIIGDVGRKLAKPPVMVYIYGSMMSSIKRKILNTVVMPKVYDILLSDTISKIPYIDNAVYSDKAKGPYDLRRFLFGDMTSNLISSLAKEIEAKGKDVSAEVAMATAKNQVALLKILFKDMPQLQFKKIIGNAFGADSEKLMKNVVIPDAVVRRLSRATSDTLGASFEKGFSEFSEIDNYRDTVKSAEVVRFTMFKYKLKQGVDKIKKRMNENGEYMISARDIATVISNLEKDGFGHSVDDINGGKQPLYKKDALEKNIRTMLALNAKGANGEWIVRSAGLEGKEYASNTGASGVITVHNIDGFIDSVSARMFDLIRIYDGSVSGINKLDESVEAYNQTVIDTTSWNSYNSQMNRLLKQITILEENDEMKAMIDSLSETDKESLTKTVEQLMGYGDLIDLAIDSEISRRSSFATSMVLKNMTMRDNGNRSLSVMHSYLSDSANLVVGKMNDGKAGAVDDKAITKVYKVYSDILKELQVAKLLKTVVQDRTVIKGNVINIPDNKLYKKGSATGDAKDIAMRAAAATSIVELDGKDRSSSSRTTSEVLPWDSNKAIDGIVMLARNGSLSGQALDSRTIKQINEAHERLAEFVVGDMPNVDNQFIDYLNKIGAKYTVYTTEQVGNRIDNSSTGSVKANVSMVENENKFPEYSKLLIDAINSKRNVQTYMNKQMAVDLIRTRKGAVADASGDAIRYADFDSLLADKKLLQEIASERKESVDSVVGFINYQKNYEATGITKLHEHIHVAAVDWMMENQDAPETKYINRLFDKLKDEARTNKELASLHDGYWMTNIDEFLAVALSDEKMIKFLSTHTIAMNETKDIKKSVLNNLVAKIMGVLGFTKDSTLDFMLHSLANIIDKSHSNKDSMSYEEFNAMSDAMSNEMPKIEDNIDYSGMLADSDELQDFSEFERIEPSRNSNMYSAYAYEKIKAAEQKIIKQMGGTIDIGRTRYDIVGLQINQSSVEITMSKNNKVLKYSFPFGSSTSLPTKNGKTVTTSYLHLYTDVLKTDMPSKSMQSVIDMADTKEQQDIISEAFKCTK